MDSLKTQLVNELKCRPAGQAIDIPALVQDYGPEVKRALWELRYDDVVRLVTCSTDLAGWLSENGYTEAQVIRGECEVFGRVELA
jgi:hypothetical protein